eukprot:TRINITY_DN10678_c0_g1_i1.p1 TRINITY_DN10678_c0_g1~~TRINITY_DN10678_c0_g1_i1.p1  ORF type:complete len:906 (-),score=82.32 TRINITY_DN10678_c0_g1_i1:125-2842(-)
MEKVREWYGGFCNPRALLLLMLSLLAPLTLVHAQYYTWVDYQNGVDSTCVASSSSSRPSSNSAVCKTLTQALSLLGTGQYMTTIAVLASSSSHAIDTTASFPTSYATIEITSDTGMATVTCTIVPCVDIPQAMSVVISNINFVIGTDPAYLGGKPTLVNIETSARGSIGFAGSFDGKYHQLPTGSNYGAALTIKGYGVNVNAIVRNVIATRSIVWLSNSNSLSVQGQYSNNIITVPDAGGFAGVVQVSFINFGTKFNACTFTNNSVIGGKSGGSAIGGTAIYASALIPALAIDGCTFTDNSAYSPDGADVYGGAIVYTAATGDPSSGMSITNSNFIRNEAVGASVGNVAGGAVYINVQKAANLITNCQFDTNAALNSNSSGLALGGALYSTNTMPGTLNLTSDFTCNAVRGASSTLTDAGGGAFIVGNYSISGNFTGNTVGKYGPSSGPVAGAAAAVYAGFTYNNPSQNFLCGLSDSGTRSCNSITYFPGCKSFTTPSPSSSSSRSPSPSGSRSASTSSSRSVSASTSSSKSTSASTSSSKSRSASTSTSTSPSASASRSVSGSMSASASTSTSASASMSPSPSPSNYVAQTVTDCNCSTPETTTLSSLNRISDTSKLSSGLFACNGSELPIYWLSFQNLVPSGGMTLQNLTLVSSDNGTTLAGTWLSFTTSGPEIAASIGTIYHGLDGTVHVSAVGTPLSYTLMPAGLKYTLKIIKTSALAQYGSCLLWRAVIQATANQGIYPAYNTTISPTEAVYSWVREHTTLRLSVPYHGFADGNKSVFIPHNLTKVTSDGQGLSVYLEWKVPLNFSSYLLYDPDVNTLFGTSSTTSSNAITDSSNNDSGGTLVLAIAIPVAVGGAAILALLVLAFATVALVMIRRRRRLLRQKALANHQSGQMRPWDDNL